MFATHIVGTCETVTEWRPSQDVVILFGVAHRERQIRVAAGDEFEIEWACRAADVFFEPFCNFWRINSGADCVAHHHATYLICVTVCQLQEIAGFRHVLHAE